MSMVTMGDIQQLRRRGRELFSEEEPANWRDNEAMQKFADDLADLALRTARNIASVRKQFAVPQTDNPGGEAMAILTITDGILDMLESSEASWHSLNKRGILSNDLSRLQQARKKLEIEADL